MCGIVLKLLATPAGIEPATNSLEVVRKANNFNAHSDKTTLLAALLNKPKFQFVGMTKLPATGRRRKTNCCSRSRNSAATFGGL
jgi:hypothetical protein